MTSSSHIIVILAGGEAKRFGGQDKGAIEIGGQRIIDILCERLAPQSNKIIISGPHDYGLALEIVSDVADAPGGPAGGLYSIWKALSGRGVDGFYTVAVDGPNIPFDLTERLYSNSTSTIATDKHGRHPTYGWWRMADLTRVFIEIDLPQSLSLNKFADLAGAKEVVWEGDKSFININRPEDLEIFISSVI